MLLDILGGAVLVAVLMVCVTALAGAFAKTPSGRFIVTAIAGLWAGAAIALASTGALTTNYGSKIPLIGVLVAAPLLVVAITAAMSPKVREGFAAIPTELLIWLNVERVLGVLFLLLAAEGRLDGPFPYVAGWGDIIAGLAVIPLALAVSRGTARPGWLWAWNIFGALDLLTALTLGVLSFNGTPMQLIHAGVGTDIMQRLPWSLIPTVLVPIYLMMHGIMFVRLLSARRLPRAAVAA